MKKTILIISAVLITSSLMAIGYINWNMTETNQGDASSKKETACNEEASCKKEQPKKAKIEEEPEFVFDIDHRFLTSITKEKLLSASSVFDLLPQSSTKGMSEFREVKVAIFSKDHDDDFAKGKNSVLNKAQLNLLKTTDYATNFYIEAYCKNSNDDAGRSDNYRFVYYVSIVPEKLAKFENGQASIIEYLKEKSKDEVAKVDMDVLKGGKASFTISKDGKITNVEIDSESGYKSLDQKMIDLITALPGKWTPATNVKGENIEQQLVFSYGYMGC